MSTDKEDSATAPMWAQICMRCPRLVKFRCANAREYPDYHNAPVAAWGSDRATLLVVGLAPGLRGANRTGRPFTGDASGQALFDALVANDFAVRIPGSPEPGLSGLGQAGVRLRQCTITNAVRCVPPENRPNASELANCRSFLEADIETLHPPRAKRPRCIVTLGREAYATTMRVLMRAPGDFRHGMERQLAARLWLLASFHPSRRNMNTRKITQEMLDAIFARARHIVDGGNLD